MTRKALQLVVDLEIQAVTCPGVWLCPNGNVQLLFSMLGQEVQTKRLPPVFPLLFHEKVTLQKTFSKAGCLAEVQDALAREDVYAVLLQEVGDCGAAVQLARFHSSALHILYPSPCAKGLLAGVDVDLLMEASADYPGILSPKIELSTKTMVKEVTSCVTNEGFIINPRTLSSQKIISPLKRNAADIGTIHSNRKYCLHSHQQSQHGRKANNRQATNKPAVCQFVKTANLPQYQQSHCHSKVKRHQSGHEFCTGKGGYPNSVPECQGQCQCGAGHLTSNCPLCTQYLAVFSSSPDFHDLVHECKNQHPDVCNRNHEISSFDRTKRLSKALHAHVDKILEPAVNDVFCERDQLHPYMPSQQSLYSKTFKSGPSHQGHPEENFNQRMDTQEAQRKTCQQNPNFQKSCGSGDEFTSHRQLFYANLEKFYRKLYDRAKIRAHEVNKLS